MINNQNEPFQNPTGSDNDNSNYEHNSATNLLETTLLQKVMAMLTVYPSEIPPMDITPLNNKPILINLSTIYKTSEMIKKRNYELPAIYYAPRTTNNFLHKPSLHIHRTWQK